MESSHAIPSTGSTEAPSEQWTHSRKGATRLVCLLTTLHPERALSNALVQHLSQEMPDMDFTLRSEDPDVVWVCGFEPGAENLVRELRLQHPAAVIVVTGRGSVKSWSDGVPDTVLALPRLRSRRQPGLLQLARDPVSGA